MNDSLIADIKYILYKSNFDDSVRLSVARNMVLYVLMYQSSSSIKGQEKKRKDTIIRELVKNNPETLKKVNDWIYKAMYGRYYLSYLRRGLISFLKNGDIESSLVFKCSQEDLLFCLDILKESNMIDEIYSWVKTLKEPTPIFFSDKQLEDFMKKITYTIRVAKLKMSFLIKYAGMEESFLETELKLWAYRTFFIKEGTTDICYLVNYTRQSVSNHASNILYANTAKKRNGGLIRSKDGETNTNSDYEVVTMPLTDELIDVLKMHTSEFFKDDSLKKYINSSDLSDEIKVRIFSFFDVMLGKKNEKFEQWVSESYGFPNDDDLKLREYALQYFNLIDYLPILKNAYEIVNDYSVVKDHEVNQAKVFLEKDDFKKAKKMQIYSKEFIAFLKAKGFDENKIILIPMSQMDMMIKEFYKKETN